MLTHISKNLAQQIVGTVKDVCGFDINFINQSGLIFASTSEARIGEFHEIGRKVAQTGTMIEVYHDNDFPGTNRGVNLPVHHNGNLIAVIGISGDPDEVKKYALLAEKITHLLIREQEVGAYSHSQAEKMNYVIQSLIAGQIPDQEYLSDFLKGFQLSEKEPVRLICIHLDNRINTANLSMMEQQVEQLFSFAGISLHTCQYPFDYLAICPEKDFEKSRRFFLTFAENNQALLKVSVSCVTTIYRLEHAYETSQIALNSIKASDHFFVCYDDLTLEMLLGDITALTSKEYLLKTVGALSEEDKSLLLSYYQQDMSLEQTSRLLFLHKNTLQYKLDRIHRLCGFNPRRFQDAVLLYVAIRLEQLSL